MSSTNNAIEKTGRKGNDTLKMTSLLSAGVSVIDTAAIAGICAVIKTPMTLCAGAAVFGGIFVISFAALACCQAAGRADEEADLK